jgi:PAS domain S-box-containing protein
MADLMRKTKKELVAHIEELENAAVEQDVTVVAAEDPEIREELEAVREQLTALTEENRRLQDRHIAAQEEKDRLREEHEDLKVDFIRLSEQNEKVLREKAQLLDQFSLLERDFEELQTRFRECRDRYALNYDLFKSFVDDNERKILLLDSGYNFRYINQTAAEALGISDEAALTGRRIFDFIPYQESLKLKERIDRAFLNGDKEKIKDIRFQGPDGTVSRLKMKIARVRFQDKPSVKIVLK